MRLRIERRLRKQVRKLEHRYAGLARTARRYERLGVSFEHALHNLAVDPAVEFDLRSEAAKLLSPWNRSRVTACLVRQFFAIEDADKLWELALILERADDRRSVGPLIRALDDSNVGRRGAAARALGWMRSAGRQSVLPLTRVLLDSSQPVAVRVEAAESLAYTQSSMAIPALISTVSDPDVEVRFWSVFALGGVSQFLKPGRGDREAAVKTLESVLLDEAVPPGNWWSVGREALAMLASFQVREGKYEAQKAGEIERIMSDPAASPEDRRWAEFYG